MKSREQPREFEESLAEWKEEERRRPQSKAKKSKDLLCLGYVITNVDRCSEKFLLELEVYGGSKRMVDGM